MRRISVDERRARLGLRHGLAAPLETPEQAAGAVVALHGTDAASVFLSALARMRDGDVAGVEHALYEERSLLRVLSMRRTMFVAPVETAAIMLAACSRGVAARERRKLIGFLEAAGVGGAQWLAGGEAGGPGGGRARGGGGRRGRPWSRSPRAGRRPRPSSRETIRGSRRRWCSVPAPNTKAR